MIRTGLATMRWCSRVNDMCSQLTSSRQSTVIRIEDGAVTVASTRAHMCGLGRPSLASPHRSITTRNVAETVESQSLISSESPFAQRMIRPGTHVVFTIE